MVTRVADTGTSNHELLFLRPKYILAKCLRTRMFLNKLELASEE